MSNVNHVSLRVRLARPYGDFVVGRKGTCTVASPAVARTSTEITFRVMGATAAGYTYDKGANHDPDGSSDGTTITITKSLPPSSTGGRAHRAGPLSVFGFRAD